MDTWEEVKSAVEDNGNVMTVNMGVLRDVHGAGRLSSYISAEIGQKLLGVGVAFIPRDLPTYQHELVRLYNLGTDIGKLIEVIMTPGEQTDKILLSRPAEPKVDYAEIVRKIRDLVVE